jgi:aquaporin Z
VTGALRRHWPEYLMEAWGLGVFMVSACLVTALFEHPGSPVHAAVPDAVLRRALIGIGMGLTAAALIYSPWGKQSGAHLNPSVTLTFLRLGKVPANDAAFYVAAQFLGGTLGVLLSALLLQGALADPAVFYAVTVPGPQGVTAAFAGEMAISFLLMLVVLFVSSHPRIGPYTGLCAASLVALYIAVEAPLSGMSMNPARTVASAVAAHRWTAAWIYFVAPPAGMLLAAEAFRMVTAGRRDHCAKLHHHSAHRCIFCEAAQARGAGPATESSRATA